MTTVERAVPGFLPSISGLHFANRFPHGPALRWRGALGGPLPLAVELSLGDAASGLCGGMANVVADLFAAGVAPPPDREPPAPESDLYLAIVRRQVDSLGLGLTPARFYRLAIADVRVRSRIAVRDAWPAIRAEIDGGRPAIVGLLHVDSADPRRLGANHQVLAHAYTLDAPARTVDLAVYDPNHADDDSVRLRIELTDDGTSARFGYLPGDAPVVGILHLRHEPRSVAPGTS